MIQQDERGEPWADQRPEPRAPLVHQFYLSALNRHRATGQPIVAFCGYVLRRGSGRPPEVIAADAQCSFCETVRLELLWARS